MSTLSVMWQEIWGCAHLQIAKPIHDVRHADFFASHSARERRITITSRAGNQPVRLWWSSTGDCSILIDGERRPETLAGHDYLFLPQMIFPHRHGWLPAVTGASERSHAIADLGEATE